MTDRSRRAIESIINGPLAPLPAIRPRIGPDPGVLAAFRALLGPNQPPEVRILARAVSVYGAETTEYRTVHGAGRRISARFTSSDDRLAAAFIADRLGWRILPPVDDVTLTAVLPAST